MHCKEHEDLKNAIATYRSALRRSLATICSTGSVSALVRLQ
jgi:hypothetical protein